MALMTTEKQRHMKFCHWGWEHLPLGMMGTYRPPDPTTHSVAAKLNWKQNFTCFHFHLCCLGTPEDTLNPCSP